MKKNLVLIILSIILLIFSTEESNSQYFNKYYMWTSEKHIWPGTDDLRLPFRYNKIIFTLSGNFYGATTNNGIDIPGVAYLVKHPDYGLYIYTVESRGYRVFDPVFEYNSATFTNAQEGLNLDYTGNMINGQAAEGDAYTDHPTVERFVDANNVFTYVDSIKFAVSGNFYSLLGKDQIMIVYDKSNTEQKFVCLSNNQTDTVNYRFVVDNPHSMNYIRNNDSINIAQVVQVLSGDYDGDFYDEIAVMSRYDDGGSWWRNKIHLI